VKEGIPSRLEKDCHTFQVLAETPRSVIARLTSSAEAISVGQEIATHLSGARNDTGVVPGDSAIGCPPLLRNREGRDSFTPRYRGGAWDEENRLFPLPRWEKDRVSKTKPPCSFRTKVLIYTQSWKLRFGFAEWVRMGFAHWVMRVQRRKVD